MKGPVRMLIAGDLMISHKLHDPNLPGTDRGSQGVVSLLRDADLFLANLEIPLTTRGQPADKAITFRAPPELVKELPKLGLRGVSIANNHALDYGADGLLETLERIREAGIAITGGGSNLEEALSPMLFERKNLKIAWFGIACTLPPGFAASKSRAGVAPIRVFSQFVIDSVSIDEQPGMAPYVRTWAQESDIEVVSKAISQGKTQADFVGILLHWGVPNGWVAAFQDPLAEYQVPLAQRLAEAGADVVVGHHPHVLQGIKKIGSCWVLFSLGNFLFHSLGAGSELSLSRNYPPYRLESLSGPDSRQSALVEVKVGYNGIEELKLIPIELDSYGEPTLARESVAREILERVKLQSKPMGVTVAENGILRSFDDV